MVDNILNEAAQVATDRTQSPEARLPSICLLAFDDFDSIKKLLPELLSTGQPQEVQCEAVRVLGSFNSPEAVPLLLANWRTQTPPVRTEVVTAMLGVRARALPLLKAVDRGLISANQIPIHQRRNLERSRVAEVRELATKLFSGSAPGPRKEVIEKYKPALSLQTEATRGREVFEKHCIACHRAGDLGASNAGPNLASIRAWNPEQVLINILDPNREVAPNFVAYTVVTTAGRVIDGLIAEDGVAALTLIRSDGKAETVLRSDIEEISGAGASLMPEGLENHLSQQNMADLIAFLLVSDEIPDRTRRTD